MLLLNTEKLQFDKVLDIVKSAMITERAREIADETEVSADLNEVNCRLGLLQDLSDAYLDGDEMRLDRLYDVTETIEAIRKQIFYHHPADYKHIQYILEESERLKRFLEKREKKNLSDFAGTLHVCKETAGYIDARVDDEGNIRENGSKKLSELCRRETALIKKMESTLGGMIRKYSDSGLLQEDFYTTRNDRFVIPVKSSSVKKINGIVQGGSGSGNTMFVEPMPVVELNNELISVRYGIEEEKKRILSDMGRKIASDAVRIQETAETLYRLDCLLSQVKFGLDTGSFVPRVNKEGVISIQRGRHPLLDTREVVPIDVWIKDGKRGVVITGPNAGGKSVTLKTMGLFTMMTMYGMMIPAEPWSEISLFDNIFVDIGDFQSIEMNLSTFSGHIVNLKRFSDDVDSSTLILLDEVGVGTDPEEGASLAMSLLEHFLDRGAVVAVTTHYNALKRHAMNDDRLENASCLFDYEKIEPLYKIKVGIPGSSNGLLVATRLGMPGKIVDKARQLMDKENLQLEETITRLEKELTETEKLKSHLEIENRQLQKKMSFYEGEIKKITKKRERKKMESLGDFEREFHDIREELNSIVNKARNNEITEKELRSKQKKVRTALDKVRKERDRVEKKQERIRDVKEGDTVFLERYGVKGKVTDYDQRKKIYSIDCGGISLKIPEKEMVGRKTKSPERKKSTGYYAVETRNTFIGTELVLVGMETLDAEEKLKDFFSYALLKGYDEVRIIHGSGTGRLRSAVHDYLRKQKNVREFHLESGRGAVTVVRL